MIFKRKMNKNIKIIFLIYFIITFFINVFKILQNIISKIEIYDLAIWQLFTFFLIIVFTAIIYTLISNSFIIIALVAIKFANKRAKKDKLNKIDFEKYKGYYRDIIKDYSPAVLSYIDDFQINQEKDIAATVLGLKLKKIIEINANELKNNNLKLEELDKNERYILENIPKNIIKENFENLVIQDAIKDGLLKPEIKINIKIVKIIIFLICIMPIISIIIFGISNTFNYKTTNEIAFLLIGISIMIICPVFLVIYLIMYLNKATQNKYIRTEKGEEVNEKLEGLKNYIKEYSKLDEKSAKDLIVWEEYLIYSVIFNQNEKIIKELSNIKKVT